MTDATLHAKYVMQQAWALARRGCRTFGGTPKQYLAEAMRIVWAETLADPVCQEIQKIIAETRAQKAGLGAPLPRPSRRVRVFGGAYL